MLNEELIAQAKLPLVFYVNVFAFRFVKPGVVQYLIFKRRSNVQMPDIWQPICGKISKNESIKEAFFSQLRKKTGLAPLRVEPIDSVTTYYDYYYDSVLLVPNIGAELPVGEINMDAQLHCEYRWVQYELLQSHIAFQGQRKCYALLHKSLKKASSLK